MIPRLLLGAAALAIGLWLALSAGTTHDVRLEAPPGPRSREPTPVPPEPMTRAPSPAQPIDPPEEPDASAPDWPARIFEVPAGEGPLAGAALLEAVERSGDWRFVGGGPGDLEALRALNLEVAERGTTQPYAALAGWLKEAGFLLEARYPKLIVRRRSDEEFATR